MSDDTTAARPPEPGQAGTELCVLLACFGGTGRAAKARGTLDRQIQGAGGRILDQVVLRVSGKRKAMVYDPRRVLLGILTPALTWGLFGLIAGGLSGFGIWAIIGAVCGGVFAYYSEHLLTKDELRRLGRHLPRQSSAILAFVRGGSSERILSSVAGSSPAEASVAAIGGDLSAQVVAGADDPVVSSSVPAGGAPVPASNASMLSMLLMRYRGKDTARQTAAKATHQPGTRGQAVEPELLIEVPQHGRSKVVAPTKLGVAGYAKTATISWGLFGLVYGVIVGAVGNNGALGDVKTGVVTAIAWAAFGLAAGALFGLWAGRAVSARRLKGLEPLLPPGSSTVIAWSEDNLTDETVGRWSQPGSDRLILRFNQVSDGALLEV